ncbi:hypothetical protein DFQ28_002272 [Apophysomyces sp. BC1034]|nr:hypothetical protein DFQ30_002694 [Apophysomyces sp. BC1015]KAG0179342.1 hypothetical protein DFQ29_002232 [Apophysomyces sp. BC1021]KAG0190265.1 hypothetical protein DFQ28_002272 [Apophysomyces sp. BC1034]
MSAGISNVRGNRRLIVLSALLFIACIFVFSIWPTRGMQCSHTTTRLPQPNDTAQYKYLNLNSLDATDKAKDRGERILVLTPVLDSAHLQHYFELLDRTTYPNHLITIGLLLLNQDEETQSQVNDLASNHQHRWFKRFQDIHIYQHDFEVENDNGQYDSLVRRRSTLARARNVLLSAALQDNDHSWVAWVDPNLSWYPPTIFEDLTKIDADVVAPNCLLDREPDVFWAYDRNNWQETDDSLRQQRTLDENIVWMEAEDRRLMVDMPTHLGKEYKVPLDGVGGTFTLVKAHVHREGANFPPFVYKHQLDTEGFAKMAKAMGFSVYGIPAYRIFAFDTATE